MINTEKFPVLSIRPDAVRRRIRLTSLPPSIVDKY